jgi:hypothetical protein
VAFLGRDKGEAFREIKTHLVSKNASGSGSGAVRFFNAFF